ncbi:C39 family peptidase [Nocardioides dongkuii]|uniref:C39 family peptidase n=1 Tax=Nocardioides dongkuii TaxID=2760089 RepID=UPI0015FC1D4E|nr:C39 family peptidase [Nocardioides dongkuii]
MSRPRPRTLALGALALILCATPFVPRGGDDDNGAITPSGQAAARPAATAGFGTLTPEAQAEIDRVLAQGASVSASTSARRSPEALAAGLARCAEFEGQRYCLGSGWTQDTPAEVQARVAASARAATTTGRRVPVEQTGDLDAAALLERTAALPAAERAELERAELTMAARSVAKVWLLRHEIQGEPLPDGFLERHPEAQADGTPATTARTAAVGRQSGPADYPEKAVIMRPGRVSSQNRTYWCGPTSMQMIAWGWTGTKSSQGGWARKLGTTTSGSSIWDMVRVTNESTGWDRKSHAGPYVVLDIGDWSYREWKTLLMRHLADYRAPVVLHPILLERFYPYLDDDASGHFQVGRGYTRRPGKPVKISYFEPWNQQRFDPSEPYIERVQWRAAYKSYRGNLAHHQHNIGV